MPSSAPTVAATRGDAESALGRLLADLVGTGVVSAAAALVGTPAEVLWEGQAGEAQPGVPAGPETRFDLASLTKPLIATLALVLARDVPFHAPSRSSGRGPASPLDPPMLDSSGRETALPLDRSGRETALPLALTLREVWGDEAVDGRLGRQRLAALLRHRAGLPAWVPLYASGGARTVRDVEALLLGGSLPRAGAGTYSDLDVLLWARSAERRLGTPLAELLASRVLAPLKLSSIGPSPGAGREVARSYLDTAKEVQLAAAQGIQVERLGAPAVGVPQDGNARFLLGRGLPLAGHAGLFGNARDLWRLGAEWLRPESLLHAGEVAAALAGRGAFALGWWRRRADGGGGRALSPAAFGHTGFTGGSLWLDPAGRRIHVLLAHRREADSDMNRWRRRFHALAVKLAHEPIHT